MKRIFYLLLLTLATSACTENRYTGDPDDVRIDQVGYVVGRPKMAFVEGHAECFRVVDKHNRIVLEGQAKSERFWPEAGVGVSQIDFSDLDVEGIYTLVVDDTLASHPITISKNPYTSLACDVQRALYYNRTAMAIDSVHGKMWAREAGHADNHVLVHRSAATKKRPEGTVISSAGGWYDAGDYNKYIVNSSISTYTMLLAAQLFSSSCSDNTNIPESGNGLSDLVDEALYNLRWMLTMQDPDDGGAYHKLTTLSFEGFIMPKDCRGQRYVVAKSTAATLDLAATAAFAARTLPRLSPSLKGLADSCLCVAESAFAWAQNNPNVLFVNPDDVSTGEYGDNNLNDEWFWAATEMWLTTSNDAYADIARQHDDNYGIPAWAVVGTLAHYSMIAEGKIIKGLNEDNRVSAIASALLKDEAHSPINLSMTNFDWGSNSFVANAGMLKLMAARATGDDLYTTSALNDLHYLLGRNATGYCFVTGAGAKQPMHIHHRPSAADGNELPVPGFHVGGPKTVVKEDCKDLVQRSTFPAKSYADAECSYSTNEVAINWNAPLIFLLYGLMQ